MKKNTYRDIFNSVLLEQDNFAPPQNPRHDVPDNSIENILDDETDPQQFLTRGLADTFDKIKEHFESEINKFSSSLSPEASKSLTVGELKDKAGDLFSFAEKIQVFSKAKIDALSQDPYAIMAAFVATDPTKLNSFNELHKSVSSFQDLLEEIDSSLSTIESKLSDFKTEASKEPTHDQMQEFQSDEGDLGIDDDLDIPNEFR